MIEEQIAGLCKETGFILNADEELIESGGLYDGMPQCHYWIIQTGILKCRKKSSSHP